MTTPAKHPLTPSQLNTVARNLLEDSFSQIWIEGELGHVSRPTSGHLYSTLKDSRAQIRCVMFRGQNVRLKFRPVEGMLVLGHGRLTVYEARGDYQFVLDHLEEAGAGALHRAFEQLRARLDHEGLFAQTRKRPLPAFSRRIAIITSASGAAICDVLSVLARRFPLVAVDLLPCQVQGNDASTQLITQLQKADRSQRYDVILLTRGGGSLEDLWPFNDETLVRAIANTQTCVVSAVGHESDFTLCDFAADERAATPSAAAELLVPEQTALQHTLAQLRHRLRRLYQNVLDQHMQRCDQLAARLHLQQPALRLPAMQQRLFALWRRWQQAQRRWQESANAATQQLQIRLLAQTPNQRMALFWERLHHLRLDSALNARLHNYQIQLASIGRSLHIVSPWATVSRGYAIVTQPSSHQLIRDANTVHPGQSLTIRLANGELQVTVIRANS